MGHPLVRPGKDLKKSQPLLMTIYLGNGEICTSNQIVNPGERSGGSLTLEAAPTLCHLDRSEA
jgi:hypothetical protein